MEGREGGKERKEGETEVGIEKGGRKERKIAGMEGRQGTSEQSIGRGRDEGKQR